MTTLAEQVESEQEEYERGDEDEDEGAEDEDEGAEEAEEGEQEQLEAIGPGELAKAEKAIQGQRKRLAGILGESYVAHDCPLCAALGFVPELPPLGTQFLATEEEGGLVLLAKPPEEALPLVQARDKAMCDWCEGYGQVTSGARNEYAAVVPCTKCAGNGWVMVAVAGPLATPAYELPVVAAPEPVNAAAQLGQDAWGRPPGHQHWGVPPAQIPG